MQRISRIAPKAGMAVGAMLLTVAALAPDMAAAQRHARASAPTSVHRGGGGGGARAAPSRSNVQGNGAQRNNVQNNAQRNNVQRNGGNNRVNTGDVNIGNGNRNTNINIDNDHGGDWNDNYHPIARGVAFGTAAAVTAAAVGSMMYTLPPACSPYRTSYYYCGGVYYEPQYQGDKVVYVVVPQP
jgi:hypothetical protein